MKTGDKMTITITEKRKTTENLVKSLIKITKNSKKEMVNETINLFSKYKRAGNFSRPFNL